MSQNWDTLSQYRVPGTQEGVAWYAQELYYQQHSVELRVLSLISECAA
jgi:hypothetical protein